MSYCCRPSDVHSLFEGEGGHPPLSEREVDCLLSRFHHRGATASAKGFLPFHLVILRMLACRSRTRRRTALLSAHVNDFISLQLFADDTVFPLAKQEVALRKLLSNNTPLRARAPFSSTRRLIETLHQLRPDLFRVVIGQVK
jgi:hypothetical protein